MARSGYAYVVQDADGEVVAAFTVKWELGLWLRRFPGTEWKITRVRDGVAPGVPVQIDPADAREVSAT